MVPLMLPNWPSPKMPATQAATDLPVIAGADRTEPTVATLRWLVQRMQTPVTVAWVVVSADQTPPPPPPKM